MKTITLDLPWPPSLNHYYRHAGPKVLISKEGRAYRKAVCALVADKHVTTLTGPVNVSLRFSMPDRRRRDLDNLLKALFDALQHAGVYRDDSQIQALHAYKCPIRPGGSVFAVITPNALLAGTP